MSCHFSLHSLQLYVFNDNLTDWFFKGTVCVLTQFFPGGWRGVLHCGDGGRSLSSRPYTDVAKGWVIEEVGG